MNKYFWKWILSGRAKIDLKRFELEICRAQNNRDIQELCDYAEQEAIKAFSQRVDHEAMMDFLSIPKTNIRARMKFVEEYAKRLERESGGGN